jgi:hypothetical protein
MERETGMQATQFFADQKARVAEIETLTQQYNTIVAAKDQQIAQSYDALGSTNFINNRIAQINRNAAPELNRLSANINAKAATMEALQGNFDRAQNYISQAVQDATADKKEKLEAFSMFYQMNQDTLKRLDTKYQSAFNSAFELAKLDYANTLQTKETIAKLQLENPQTTLNINGTLEAALAAIQANPMSPSRRYQEAQISNIYADNARLGSEAGSGSTTSTNPFSDVMTDALKSGASPEQAAREAAAVSEASGVPVDQKTLTAWAAQARALKTQLDAAKPKAQSGGFNTPGQGPMFVAQQQVQSRAQGNFGSQFSQIRQSVGGFFNRLFGN